MYELNQVSADITNKQYMNKIKFLISYILNLMLMIHWMDWLNPIKRNWSLWKTWVIKNWKSFPSKLLNFANLWRPIICWRRHRFHPCYEKGINGPSHSATECVKWQRWEPYLISNCYIIYSIKMEILQALLIG